MLEGDDLVDKVTRDVFALFWKTIVLLVEEVLPVKNERSGLNFSYFLSSFLFSFILFLEPGIRRTRSRCHTAGHIR